MAIQAARASPPGGTGPGGTTGGTYARGRTSTARFGSSPWLTLMSPAASTVACWRQRTLRGCGASRTLFLEQALVARPHAKPRW